MKDEESLTEVQRKTLRVIRERDKPGLWFKSYDLPVEIIQPSRMCETLCHKGFLEDTCDWVPGFPLYRLPEE